MIRMVCIKSSGGSGWGDLNISLDPIYERRSYYIRFDDRGDVWVYKDKVHPTKGLEPWNKGVIMTQVECPHCGIFVNKGNLTRWHFDNCKNKKSTE